MTPSAYAEADATALAGMVRDGAVSALQLVEHALAAREATSSLNAFVFADDEAARARAAGPLTGPFAGVPLAIKDFDGMVQGQPFTASTRFLEGFRAPVTHAALGRLLAAGFVPVGRTNLPELALLGTTEPAWRGPTRNPWSPDHSVGGSSGGSAAAVAARVVPVAHGGDGGGSIRIPASAAGLVGLKPTRGRVSLAPDGEGWGGYVQWGALTRTVRDCAALLDVMAGPEPGDPYAAPAGGPFLPEVGRDPGRLRIAVHAGSLYGRDTHPDCARAVSEAAGLLSRLGHDVVSASPALPRDALVRAYLTQVAVGTAVEIRMFERWTGRTARSWQFEPATWFLRQVGDALGAVELAEARDVNMEAGRRLADFHRDFDVWLTPTLAHPPARIGEGGLTTTDRAGLAILRRLPVGAVLRSALARLAENALERTPNTQLFNQTGQPAVSVPLGQSGALPIGVQLSGRMGEEGLLLRVAAQLEEVAPWSSRRPVVAYGEPVGSFARG